MRNAKALADERDDLLAENERLRALLRRAADAFGDEINAAGADDNSLFPLTVQEYCDLEDEIRAALKVNP